MRIAISSTVIRIVLISGIFSITQDILAQSTYEKAWKALNENKWAEASKLLAESENEPQSFEDAYITDIYLHSYKGQDHEIKNFSSSFYQKAADPYPYIYSLWFNNAVAGPYGKKQFSHQLDFLNALSKDAKAPGTLVCAANYQLGMHHLFSANFKKADEYFPEVSSVRNWQFTGPFENLSQSGFYKDYGPVTHAGQDAVFESLTGAEVKWFTPPVLSNDGWIPVLYNFNQSTAVVYAQSFVSSPVDQTVVCALGGSGSLKVWINDNLIFSEPKERVTEFDTYNFHCNLKKGVNRVLVQLGFTNNAYPNFAFRFTDDQLHPIPNLTCSATYASYTSLKSPAKNELVPLFAEEYFKNKISKSPDNLINYLLLADVYLRNKKIFEARNILHEAIEKAPNNCLLKMKLAEALIKEDNRTLLLEEVEKIKLLDPESLLVLELNIKENLKAQKYGELEAQLNKRISLYGEDENTAQYKLTLLAEEKKFDELVKEIEHYYSKYPTNEEILDMMYTVKKEVDKDNKGALGLYETYMKNAYNYTVYSKYAGILSDQGDTKKALEMWRLLADVFPYSPGEFYNLSKYYYSAKQYDKAEEYIKKSLDLAPYNEVYWELLGDVKSEKQNTTGSLQAYNQSLKYNPNQFDIVNKIRKLNGKEEGYKLAPQVDIDEYIKSDKLSEAKNTDYGYYYILDEKDAIMYEGGATESYYTTILRITNDKGVEKFKESSISYGSSQSLLIEKAQVIKKNNVKIAGEKNENQIVFTNLEAGDVIVFKYRIRSYASGRFARDLWDYYYFCGQIYSAVTRYSLTLPANQSLYYTFTNGNLKPVIREIENFKQYSWELLKPEPELDEPLMPQLVDIGGMLHVSTIAAWKDVANWYSDISNTKAEEDVELIDLYKKLFPGDQKLNQFQKAKIIYNYIESNIQYSSVPFRQSAYVPQRPSLTLTTRLGDCKDLSSLFVTLAKMAGITAQMVLVDTRDNGQKHIILPSVEFNHCVVKAELDKKEYYIELTDNYLPFRSLPNNLNEAVILEIPQKSGEEKTELKLLKANNRTKDVIKRIINITPQDADLDVSVTTINYGHPSSSIRATYINLDESKQMKELQNAAARGYKNNVKITKVSFPNLEQLNDSVEFSYSYKVKNEVAEIGSLKTFRITYPDIVASLDNFSADTRTYPINYCNYEDVDVYETTVNITAPTGMKFTELPKSENFSFRNMQFSINYVLKSPNQLLIVRKFTNERENIPAADYGGFKAFFEKIVKAEQKFIAYK